MREKNLKLFNSPLTAVGLFFLLNPTVSLFDFLPDFIGYLLMYAGIYELASLDDRLTLASKKLLYLAALSAIRLTAAFATMGYNSSTIMMLCFVLAICEAILVCGFISDWFEGFDYLMQRFGAFDALKNQTNTRFLTGIFFLTRIVLGFLPEITAIFELRAYFDIDKSPVWAALASYKPYMILLFALIVFILGIYWYVNSLAYIRAIRADRAFAENAGERYAELWHDGKDDEFMLKIADYCVVFGFVFIFDFTLDMVPVLPTFVSTALFSAACLIMRRYSYSKKLWLWALAAAVSQAAFEYFTAAKVDPNAPTIAAVPIVTTVVLVLLALPYIAFSILFLQKAELQLDRCRLATTCLSPLSGWKKLNIAYYIFIAARVLSLTVPTIGSWLLPVKMISELIFIIGGIICWNRAIKIEE